MSFSYGTARGRLGTVVNHIGIVYLDWREFGVPRPLAEKVTLLICQMRSHRSAGLSGHRADLCWVVGTQSGFVSEPHVKHAHDTSKAHVSSRPHSPKRVVTCSLSVSRTDS